MDRVAPYETVAIWLLSIKFLNLFSQMYLQILPETNFRPLAKQVYNDLSRDAAAE